MPKMKTNRSAAKRFRATATGKIRRGQSLKNHMMTRKNAKRVRHLRGDAPVSASDVRRIRAILPYL